MKAVAYNSLFCRVRSGRALHLLPGGRTWAGGWHRAAKLCWGWHVSGHAQSQSFRCLGNHPGSSQQLCEDTEVCRFGHRLPKPSPDPFWGSAPLWRLGNESYQLSGFWLNTHIIWPAHIAHASCHQKVTAIAPSTLSEVVKAWALEEEKK